MVSVPRFIMGELNYYLTKNLPNFVGTKFFLTFVGGHSSIGETKLYGGSNIYYYTFITSFF